MVDRISKEKRSKIMSAIRSKNTKPEIILRTALWKSGLRYRIHYGKEKIDVAFPSKKLAILVDGCFWHSCPIHSHIPKNNLNYWLPKLAKNRERDIAKNEKLVYAGWKVLRFWEHDMADTGKVVSMIKEQLDNR
jgi:DNA mismatch endonuclease (patch repair protein)